MGEIHRVRRGRLGLHQRRGCHPHARRVFSALPQPCAVLTACAALGFDILPAVLWRKQTNSPNKFMGSGMLPAVNDVTLEHEHILLMRKGGKRDLASEDQKAARRKSAIFWEERNRWFSDIWDFKGARQDLFHRDTRVAALRFPSSFPSASSTCTRCAATRCLILLSEPGLQPLQPWRAGATASGWTSTPGCSASWRRMPAARMRFSTASCGKEPRPMIGSWKETERDRDLSLIATGPTASPS